MIVNGETNNVIFNIEVVSLNTSIQIRGDRTK